MVKGGNWLKIELHRMLLNGWFAAGICFLLMLCLFTNCVFDLNVGFSSNRS